MPLTETHGSFREALLAQAVEPEIREHSTSGGLVTSLLIHLLETGQIDGAVVIGSDKDILWKGKPRLARSREDLIDSMKSKYAISPTNVILGEIRETPGRYALVGLPCQLHGIYKAKQLDVRIKERIVLMIGLFCHAAIEHEAFRTIWNTLGEEKLRAKRFVSRFGKHPGTPHLDLGDGKLSPVYFPSKAGYRPTSMEIINILYRLYTPERCMTCFDGSGEFADISIADPWMAPPDNDIDFRKGWSFALLRTAQGQEVFRSLEQCGKLKTKSLTRKEAQGCNKPMLTEKRWRAFSIMETHRRQGRNIPLYGSLDFRAPGQSRRQFLLTELHTFTHIFCFLPALRQKVLEILLSDWGYGLLWLNHKRRQFRVWRRDTAARIRRVLFGRQ